MLVPMPMGICKPKPKLKLLHIAVHLAMLLAVLLGMLRFVRIHVDFGFGSPWNYIFPNFILGDNRLLVVLLF